VEKEGQWMPIEELTELTRGVRLGVTLEEAMAAEGETVAQTLADERIGDATRSGEKRLPVRISIEG
jgi:hypothetical protein